MRRRDLIAIGEYYHVFNRGVEKRTLFDETDDYERFLESMLYFNIETPTVMKTDDKVLPEEDDRLVDIVAYCLNRNHFHFILKENKKNGIAMFMKKICTGYAMYYNSKNDRTGVLFQGRFKSVHLSSNDVLLYVSAYVNCNSQVHGREDAESYLWCSFLEYMGDGKGALVCQKESVLGQFTDVSSYKRFCMDKVIGMQDRTRFEHALVES